MTRLEGLIKGLQLINDRLDHPNYQTVSAEHDVILGPHKDVQFTDEETAKLTEYGWRIDSDYDCWAFGV
jgi:hypothetical protein